MLVLVVVAGVAVGVADGRVVVELWLVLCLFFFFFGRRIYYFIVVVILFYCDMYIILLY